MTTMMFSLLMTFLTTRNNARRFHHLRNTFCFFLSSGSVPPEKLKFFGRQTSKSSSEIFTKFGLFRFFNRRQIKSKRDGINVSAREVRSVRRLFDATRDRTRRMGREFGTMRLYSFPFSFRLLLCVICSLSLRVCVGVFYS